MTLDTNGEIEQVIAPANLRILVVDDNESFREKLVQALTQQNAMSECVACGSGAVALERARTTAFDFVITDVVINGGMDGVNFASSLRGVPGYAETPIFVYSGQPGGDVLAQLQELQVADPVTFMARGIAPVTAMAKASLEWFGRNCRK